MVLLDRWMPELHPADRASIVGAGMKPYVNPKDAILASAPGTQVRHVGKRKRRKGDWKLDAVAKTAPHELDALPEDPIRRQIEADIADSGLPYLTFEDPLLHWLKRQAGADIWQAQAILAAIKDLPDFTVWRPAPGKPYSLCLPLELKRRGKVGRPGQKDFAEAAGGFITQGYTPAKAALKAFLEAPIPTHPETEAL